MSDRNLKHVSTAELELELEHRAGATKSEIAELEAQFDREIDKIRAAVDARVNGCSVEQRKALLRCMAVLGEAWPESIPAQVDAAETLVFRMRLYLIAGPRATSS